MKHLGILLALALIIAGTAWFVTRAPIAHEPVPPSAAIAPSAVNHDVALADPRVGEVRAASAERDAGLDVPQQASVPMAAHAPSDEVVARAPMSLEAMMGERIVVANRLNELSQPVLMEKLNSGSTEFLGSEPSYAPSAEENKVVYLIAMVPERGTFRAVISREERPDIYVLKDRVLELDRAIREAEAQAEQAALAPK